MIFFFTLFSVFLRNPRKTDCLSLFRLSQFNPRSKSRDFPDNRVSISIPLTLPYTSFLDRLRKARQRYALSVPSSALNILRHFPRRDAMSSICRFASTASSKQQHKRLSVSGYNFCHSRVKLFP